MSLAKTFSIADLASEFGITARAIRFYEDQGLLSPQRNGQNRVYLPRDHTRLAWILRGKRVGFTLREIDELLALYDLDDGRKTQRSATHKKCCERIDALKLQRADVDLTISELEEFCETLETLMNDEAKPDNKSCDSARP